MWLLIKEQYFSAQRFCRPLDNALTRAVQWLKTIGKGPTFKAVACTQPGEDRGSGGSRRVQDLIAEHYRKYL